MIPYIGQLSNGVVEVGGCVPRLQVTAADVAGKEPPGLVILDTMMIVLRTVLLLKHLPRLLQLKQAGHYLDTYHLEEFMGSERKAMDTPECIS